MEKKPNIAVVGILNTKFNEIKYLADQVRSFGGNPFFMDLSLSQGVDWADGVLRA